MFDFHRRDPRKTVAEALDIADRISQHGCGRDPTNSTAIDRATRLYDLALAIHELHENVAGQEINTREFEHALALVRRIGTEILRGHPEFGQESLVREAMWGLKGLLEIAGGSDGGLLGSQRDAHAAVRCLQNDVHNVYLRWRIDERRTSRARSVAMKGAGPVNWRNAGRSDRPQT